MQTLKNPRALWSALLLLVASAAYGDQPAAAVPAPEPAALAVPAEAAAAAPTIDAAALQARLARPVSDLTLLDVRTAEEFAAGHVPGARNIPVAEIEARIAELDAARSSDVVVYCHSGRRAATALQVLAAHGFAHLLHLKGDMQGWSASGRPIEGVVHADPGP
jgi:phage shock protein E